MGTHQVPLHWRGGGHQTAGVVRDCGISHLLSCHSRAGGNRAWVVISYFILEIIQRYIFYSPAIRDINLIDLIPACAGMTKVWSYWLLVTRDKPPFAEVSGDKPPRRFAAPLRRGELRPRRYESQQHRGGMRVSSHILPLDEEICSATGWE